jgi:hypothetical protein
VALRRLAQFVNSRYLVFHRLHLSRATSQAHPRQTAEQGGGKHAATANVL